MNNTLFFRDRDAVQLAVRSAAPASRIRFRPVETIHEEAAHIACQRDPLTGRFEGRSPREHRTLSDEGVSCCLRHAFAA
ncbi:hypothetical protein C7441_11678 [Pseudaminobacter salicylatoxidans]|uniref:Uncharacterized protein n=1 Tax=Pseudaminobacter salicylatoxidans TaxID=93369 RepID=A0A316BW13_PSESE|nr:hypothetical protein [Pseudaminobacter salicylatoxidans]PWJ78411.1 hypothetical protein C7441_11678 [Pseudaminobacter salicylatoxidans]